MWKTAFLLVLPTILVILARPLSAAPENVDRPSILLASDARPLSALGENAMRFSSAPALGGKGYLIEIAEHDDEWAVGRFVVFVGHPSDEWIEVLRGRLALPANEFLQLLRSVNSLMQEGEAEYNQGDGVIFVCTDGPGFLSESRLGGIDLTLEGFCGEDHPNEKINRLIRHLMERAIKDAKPRFKR